MKRTVSLILIILLLLCGCTKNQKEVNNKIKAVTTIYPLYDFVRAVGGDNVDVTLLIPAGGEVHSYEPTPSDIKAIYDADCFFYIGGESDSWVERILSDKGVNAYRLIESANLLAEDGEDEYDEHIWTSSENAVLMLRKITSVICDLDKENKEKYKNNCDKYCKEIENVSSNIRQTVENSKNKFILVADRFPFKYMASEYGIEYKAAFGGCASSTDISLKVMKRLVNTVKEKDLKYVFCTELSNQNIAKSLSEQTGVKILELHSAHNVTADDFNSGITYVDIMKRNLSVLKKGLE
ncbi:MAG: metal ABC transporter substrate-binding protein [Clostridia bacterium]|nr:metal ABC transporter substrate-binding protein [Clostridia bacterium]